MLCEKCGVKIKEPKYHNFNHTAGRRENFLNKDKIELLCFTCHSKYHGIKESNGKWLNWSLKAGALCCNARMQPRLAGRAYIRRVIPCLVSSKGNARTYCCVKTQIVVSLRTLLEWILLFYRLLLEIKIVTGGGIGRRLIWRKSHAVRYPIRKASSEVAICGVTYIDWLRLPNRSKGMAPPRYCQIPAPAHFINKFKKHGHNTSKLQTSAKSSINSNRQDARW